MQRWMIAVLWMGSLAKGQAAQSGEDPTPVLKRMAEQTSEYRKTLPNFTCDENVVSILKQKDKLKKRIEFRATVRVARTEKGEMEESFTVTNYMGQDASKGGKFAFPVYISGGLGKGMPSFFAKENQDCYDYQLGSGRIAFSGKPSATCRGAETTQGFAALDAQGDVQRGEFRRDPATAIKLKVASFGSVDYSPVTLNGQTYRLPSHLYAEMQDGDTQRTFEAYYTGCRLFHATATISPAGSTVIPD